MGMSDTTGFVLHHVIYSSVWVLPTVGYSVHGYGCSVGKFDPQVTCFKPYLGIYFLSIIPTLILSMCSIWAVLSQSGSPKTFSIEFVLSKLISCELRSYHQS